MCSAHRWLPWGSRRLLRDLLGEHARLSVAGPELEAGTGVGKLQPQTQSRPSGLTAAAAVAGLPGQAAAGAGVARVPLLPVVGRGLFVHCLSGSKVFHLLPKGLCALRLT